MTMGAPEPYFGGVEDMATSQVALSRESSFSQGDYIIKTAYASTDVSSCLLYTSDAADDA